MIRCVQLKINSRKQKHQQQEHLIQTHVIKIAQIQIGKNNLSQLDSVKLKLLLHQKCIFTKQITGLLPHNKRNLLKEKNFN